MFTFQVTRLHERHLSDYRLQGVSPLPHIVRRGAREREGESTTWQMARWDDTSVRSFLSSCLSRDLPGSFSALLRCITRFATQSSSAVVSLFAVSSDPFYSCRCGIAFECTSRFFMSFFSFNVVKHYWVLFARKEGYS